MWWGWGWETGWVLNLFLNNKLHVKYESNLISFFSYQVAKKCIENVV